MKLWEIRAHWNDQEYILTGTSALITFLETCTKVDWTSSVLEEHKRYSRKLNDSNTMDR